MYLIKSKQQQTVLIPKSDAHWYLKKMNYYIQKTRSNIHLDSINLMLSQAGLKVENMWQDEDNMFSLTLASPKIDVLGTSESCILKPLIKSKEIPSLNVWTWMGLQTSHS